MKFSKKHRYAEQFPNRGAWAVSNPSYLTIGGSGIVGNFGPESPMSNYENSESPAQEMNEGTSMESGAGAAAGAGITGAGSGVA
jgi:hypothetical protein